MLAGKVTVGQCLLNAVLDLLGGLQHPHALVANDELYAVHVDVWIPPALQGAVAKDTPLSRGIWSVTLPEVVVRFRS